MDLRRDDLSASARQYWGFICFGSFGSLFIDNINNLYTVYKTSSNNPWKFGTAHARAYPRRFLSRDKMTQMTQRLKAPGRQIRAFWVIWVNKKTMTQMTQRPWPLAPACNLKQ